MTLKRKKLILLFVSSLLLLFSAAPALASGVFIESENSAVSPGQSFQADLFLSAEGKNINAIEGRVVFPPETLELKQTIEGGSVIGLWIEKPEVKSGNQIVFSGGLPGGFSGEKGLLFSMVFRVKENIMAGNGRITAEDLKVYLDDGRGTPVGISSSSFNFAATKKESVNSQELEEIKDTNPPDPFSPYLGRNPTVYDNQWFVVFATQDKELGIDHYEVWETVQKYDINNMDDIEEAGWIKTENPHPLKDQNLESYIYVKAVDKAGNKRIEVIPPARSSFIIYKRAIVAVIIVALLFLALLFIRRVLITFKNR